MAPPGFAGACCSSKKFNSLNANSGIMRYQSLLLSLLSSSPHNFLFLTVVLCRSGLVLGSAGLGVTRAGLQLRNVGGGPSGRAARQPAAPPSGPSAGAARTLRMSQTCALYRRRGRRLSPAESAWGLHFSKSYIYAPPPLPLYASSFSRSNLSSLISLQDSY